MRHRTATLRRLLFGLVAVLVSGCAAAPGVTSSTLQDQTADTNLPSESDGRTARLISAFFGLDNALPRRANLICRGASGRDGMPVIFSTEIAVDTLQAGDFEVTTRSGLKGEMHCASFMPATDAGELRTVLLVGEFGSAATDPPVRVRVTGNVHALDGRLNFRGAEIEVTPLAPGPTIVLAEQVLRFDRSGSLSRQRTQGSTCPEDGVEQAVRVVWAGGVTLPGGGEPGQDVGELYRVTVETRDGTRREVVPHALADLGDGDNNHLLCLDTTDRPISVSFPAGILTDPNEDLNPATSSEIELAP